MMRSVMDIASEFMGWRQRDYQHTFRTVPGARALADLAVFCRANTTTFHADPRIHAVLEGRREVWLRIQNHLNLTPEELTQLARPQQAGGYPLKLREDVE